LSFDQDKTKALAIFEVARPCVALLKLQLKKGALVNIFKQKLAT
jgi:hypothetical protein